MPSAVLPDEWLVASAWPVVQEFLRWLPLDYAERKQALLAWAGESGVVLTRYHYDGIARSGEVTNDRAGG